LYTLNNCSSEAKRKLIRIVKHKNADQSSLDFLRNEVEKTATSNMQKKKTKSYRNKSMEQLDFFQHRILVLR